MRSSNWEECLTTDHTRTRTPDPAKANSLRETAHARMRFLEQPVTEENANFIFEGYYASLLELLHAHLAHNGYDVANHICIGFYLRDALDRKDLYRQFDDCRYKRNSIVYYGKRMPLETAQKSLGNIKELIRAVEKL